VVFCACDEDFSGALSHEELTTEVCKVIVQHETSAEDFASVDADGDGEVTIEEVIEWVQSHKDIETRAKSMKLSRGFSNDVHIDAMVRVLGCVCDNNGNYALDFENSILKFVLMFRTGCLVELWIKKVLRQPILTTMEKSMDMRLLLPLNLFSTPQNNMFDEYSPNLSVIGKEYYDI